MSTACIVQYLNNGDYIVRIPKGNINTIGNTGALFCWAVIENDEAPTELASSPKPKRRSWSKTCSKFLSGLAVGAISATPKQLSINTLKCCASRLKAKGYLFAFRKTQDGMVVIRLS